METKSIMKEVDNVNLVLMQTFYIDFLQIK